MTVVTIPCTEWAEDGEKVVLTKFDTFPSIGAQGPMTWTPAEGAIEFTTKKPWYAGKDYTISCPGDVTKREGTQSYVTETGAKKYSDGGSIFTMEQGKIWLVQLILVDPPKGKKSRKTLSNMSRSWVSAETGTTYTGGATTSGRG